MTGQSISARGKHRYPLDEDDLSLIDALHTHPRATFQQLGDTLGISAVTAARRWKRLVSEGQAWVTSAAGPALGLAGAVVELECTPSLFDEAVAALVQHPQIVSVHRTTGTYDLYCLVLASSMGTVVQSLDSDLGRVPGLRRTRSSIGTSMFAAVSWRLGALSRDQQAAVRRASPPKPSSATRSFTEFDRLLYLELQQDGRASIRDLATALDKSETLIKRRIDQLQASGQMFFRADFNRSAGGWPIGALLRLRVPDELVDEVGRDIGQWAETRVCCSVIGDANIVITLQVHAVQDVESFLIRLSSTWPRVDVIDRQTILRPLKSWGRVIDETGRSIGVVPADLWA